jgi:hypothetical protein
MTEDNRNALFLPIQNEILRLLTLLYIKLELNEEQVMCILAGISVRAKRIAEYVRCLNGS